MRRTASSRQRCPSPWGAGASFSSGLRFAGRATLEFATMLSFAVPGTVIGVAYVFAFNVPPLEITGTALIIVLCFIFRNMPVGVRAGMAAIGL